MNEEQAKKLMAKNVIDNYAIDPDTGKVQIKRPSKGPSDTNFPDASPKK